MSPPTNKKEIQNLAGPIAAPNKFILCSSDWYKAYFKMLQRNEDFKWIDECHEAFKDLKNYLYSPPLLKTT